MLNHRVYTHYKDSGVEWLGLVPADWDIKPLRKNTSLVSEKGTSDFTLAMENVESWTGKLLGDLSKEYETTGISFQENDLLFGKLRPYLAKVWYAPHPGSAVGDFYVIRPRNCYESPYLRYLLSSKLIIDHINSSTYGAKMPRVNWSFMGNMPLPIPPLPTQEAIVKFLDRETAHIDAGVANMESLISLLTEKRAALISETVTRGIPGGHTEFKDSGVPWLGEIPVGWEIVDPKRVFSPRAETGGAEDTHLMASQKYGVIPQSEYLEQTGKRVVEVFSEEARFKKIYADDFLIHLRSFQGGLEHCVNNGKVTAAYTVVSPNLLKFDPQYGKYLLKSKSYVSGIASTTNQLRDGQSIKWKDFRKILLPLPPMREQASIADFLRAETQKIETIIEQARGGIALLKEKRKVLISDVVTGKIDVRDSV